MPLHAGLDWGAAGHAVCVLDERGTVLARFECPHTAAGLADLLARLKRLAPPAEMPVAIERPSGLVVETLAAAGHPVVPIHPNVVKACRPRYRAAAGKSDPGDAYMLADILRTDGHRFAPLQPASDEIKALRAMVRGRDDLVAVRVSLANQLRALLDGFWPGAAAVFAAIDSPITLAFLARYPTPDRPSWPSIDTPAGEAPTISSSACGPPQPASPETPKPMPRARSPAPSCAASLPSSRPSPS